VGAAGGYEASLCSCAFMVPHSVACNWRAKMEGWWVQQEAMKPPCVPVPTLTVSKAGAVLLHSDGPFPIIVCVCVRVFVCVCVCQKCFYVCICLYKL
jgi:hypothetical protein